MKEIEFQTLIDYLDDNLTESERMAVETYLEEDPTGQQELARARQALAGLWSDDMVEPSPSLVARVRAAFRRQLNRGSDRPLRRAELQFDSWAQLPQGVRGVPQERQLLFHEGAYDLDLQVAQAQTPNDYVMRGQLLADSPGLQNELEGILLNLRNTTTGQERRGLTDQYGRFSFSQLSKGEYLLLVELDSYDIVIVLESLSLTG
jgi:hypothetical protein